VVWSVLKRGHEVEWTGMDFMCRSLFRMRFMCD
jgi:hypothetical protein